MAILITGAAGFIGYHLTRAALENNYDVIGVDNLNNYYDVKLKLDRLEILKNNKKFTFFKGSIEDKYFLEKIYSKHKIKYVVNLAAYAGVRHSLTKPHDYIDANITGFLNILELSKNYKINHLIYASSSSVYGSNSKMPSLEDENVDHPVSLYGATKKANELMAHSYSHLFDLPTTGLRFFTVYGTWGRPDMALFLFTKSIFNNEPINLFNHGKHNRDFTYIDDVVNSIIKLINQPPNKNKEYDFLNPNPSISDARYRILNIGNSDTISLIDFIRIIEDEIGIKAIKHYKDFQLGDVENSCANTDRLSDITGFKPYTPLEEGIKNFIKWYKDYYKI